MTAHAVVAAGVVPPPTAHNNNNNKPPSNGTPTLPRRHLSAVPDQSALDVVRAFATDVEVTDRTFGVLEAVARYADPFEGRARVPLSRLAKLTGRAKATVRSALVRLERAGALVVRTAPVGADGRRGVNTYQLTVGAWADRWTPPSPHRSKVGETFDKRAAAMPARRPDLEKRAQGRAQQKRRSDEKRAQGRAQGRAQPPLGVSEGARSAPPPSIEPPDRLDVEVSRAWFARSKAMLHPDR